MSELVISDPTTKLAKCRHYTGVQHDHCAAGVAYDDVRVPRAELGAETTLMPCLRMDGPRRCAKFDAVTLAELDAQEKAMMAESADILTAMMGIHETKQTSGSIPCPRCLGVLRFARAPNKHVRALCETPNCISFME